MLKSFLKWAGGKSDSLRLILDEVYKSCDFFEAKHIHRFIEPFVGSGVVFLNIEADDYIINDINTDITNIYSLLKSENGRFISDCKEVFNSHLNTEENYYAVRDKFNSLDLNSAEDKLQRAALFIYLNRHCFNGLCRYNKQGGFNVPFGKYGNVSFPEAALNSFSRVLKRTTVLNYSFEEVFKMAKGYDIIYCDPPYVPISNTASFTDYSSEGFSMIHQTRLAELAEEAPCKVLISNHDTEVTRELYKNASKITQIKINRFIASKTDSRKEVAELLAVYDKRS